jgi:hypothetical protein
MAPSSTPPVFPSALHRSVAAVEGVSRDSHHADLPPCPVWKCSFWGKLGGFVPLGWAVWCGLRVPAAQGVVDGLPGLKEYSPAIRAPPPDQIQWLYTYP